MDFVAAAGTAVVVVVVVVVVAQSPNPEPKPEIDEPLLNAVFVSLAPNPLVVVIPNPLSREFDGPPTVDDVLVFEA